MGGASGRPLSLGTVRFAFLFAGTVRRFTAYLVRTQTALVAGRFAVLGGAAHPLGTGGLSADLLLLSRGLLQCVLGRPARLYCQRTTEILLGRKIVPADPAKCPSLFPLSGDPFYRNPGL